MKQHLQVYCTAFCTLLPLLSQGLFLPAIATEPLLMAQQARPKIEQLLDQGRIIDVITLIEQNWKKQYEEYYQGRLSTQSLTPLEISDRLAALARTTRKRAALIYVVPTNTQLILIVIPPGAAPVYQRVDIINAVNLQKLVSTFKNQVAIPSSSRQRYLASAQQLYTLIIRPLEAILSKHRIDSLIFCLGNGLRSIPLAALHDGDRFLIEKFNLAIIPAFNLLDTRSPNLKNARVLAMGASEFASEEPLPAVPSELQAIANTLQRGDVLLNENFTIANLRRYRDQNFYPIVHLATHADFAPGEAQNSYIQFWDQRLPPNRFRELQLNTPPVELLVLSACRTALGDQQAELGFAGLAVMSGSKAAIASLWSVSDEGTMTLMRKFYRQLKTGTKSEALRQAQITMLTTSPQPGTAPLSLSHPYYWAAFTLIGNLW